MRRNELYPKSFSDILSFVGRVITIAIFICAAVMLIEPIKIMITNH